MSSNIYSIDPQVVTAASGSTVTSYCRIHGADYVSVQIYKTTTGSFIQTPVFEVSNFESVNKLQLSGSADGGYWVKQGLSGSQALLTSSAAPASVTYENTQPLCARWARISFTVYEYDTFRIAWCARS